MSDEPDGDSAEASDIVSMTARGLAKAIRARKVSSLEVMTAHLDQIDRLNPAANAVVALQDRDGLLSQARDRDAQLARGGPIGPLHGFPHAMKDLQPVKGIRFTRGSPIFKDLVAPADGLTAERLRAAGVIFIGKTNTPEFGLGSHTVNPVYGPTHNSHDPSRSAGGSSGGAAVALALRMVPLADGSDYGGSLRNPAGWNNVCGFRTSFGRVPVDAPNAWQPSMGVQGPMARNVADLALLLSVQAGYDPRAPLSLEGDGAGFAGPLDAELKGKRIGWLGDFGGATPCEAGVLDVCRAALKRFEALGCVVEAAMPDFDVERAWQAFIRLRAWQQAGQFLPFDHDPAQRALLNAQSIYELETALRLSAVDIIAASTVRTQWSQAVQGLFSTYDYLIAPTAQLFPFAIATRWPTEIAGVAMRTYHEWMKGVCLVTMAGCPALAMPAGFSPQGLPMGLQIIAPVHQEMACLQLGAAYEAVEPLWRTRPPPGLRRTA
ncbi:amidase [Phenylobacterium sp.]|uniref:amidase n=1 Tax=Phenylobacterium sp. TaxID=1871053 RepID=UPI0025E3F8B3|nr:amidase [Phenylobacterium sp.]